VSGFDSHVAHRTPAHCFAGAERADAAYRDSLEKLAVHVEDWETHMITGCKVWACACMRARVYVRLCVCMSVYIYIYIRRVALCHQV
jgi:hypothetical protein